MGTSDVKVTFSRASVASRASGSKLLRSSITQVAPRCVKVWLKYSELAWHIGITSSAVSLRVKPISSAVASAIRVFPSWLRTAPLGRPVVPEVYISAQGSAGRTVAAGVLSIPDSAASISAS